MKPRTLIPIAVVATAAALLLRRHRWLHDLHVALGVRALRLEGELARARADTMAISELAANALHSEMRLSLQLDRAAEQIRPLEAELATASDSAVNDEPPTGETAVDGVDDATLLKALGVDVSRYHPERIEAAERSGLGFCEETCPICHKYDVPCFPEPSAGSLDDEIHVLVAGPPITVKCGDCGFSYISEMYGGPDAACPKCIDETEADHG